LAALGVTESEKGMAVEIQSSMDDRHANFFENFAQAICLVLAVGAMLSLGAIAKRKFDTYIHGVLVR
jgi:hypothetical protein